MWEHDPAGYRQIPMHGYCRMRMHGYWKILIHEYTGIPMHGYCRTPVPEYWKILIHGYSGIPMHGYWRIHTTGCSRMTAHKQENTDYTSIPIECMRYSYTRKATTLVRNAHTLLHVALNVCLNA